MECKEQKWTAIGIDYKNIIASYLQEKQKRLIVGAHYDAAGDQPGADDNASGIAGLMETARLIAENKPDLDYGIDCQIIQLPSSHPLAGLSDQRNYWEFG